MTDPEDQAELSGDEAAANESMAAQLETMTAERDGMAEHIAQLEKELDATKTKLAKANTAAKAKPAQGRKVAVTLALAAGVDDDGNPVAGSTLLSAAIGAAESVELVALDAKGREIAGFTQEIVGGAGAWRLASNGLALNLPDPLLVTAPPERRSEIHAWGLFLDGKAAAFAARFEPLALNAGQKTDLSGDVVF